MNDDKNTSNNSEPWEGEMADEFDRRVRDLHEAPLSIDQVRGRAISIRRRRRAAVAGSILAAAAVIVPVAVLAANPDSNDSRRPIQPVATTATETPSQTPAPEAPRVPAYVEGTSYHRGDGSVLELPRATYEEAVTLGDRVVASSRDDQGNVTIDVIEGSTITDSFEATSDFVADSAGTSVAFVRTDGIVQTVFPDTTVEVVDGYEGWSVRALSAGTVFLRNDLSQSPLTAIDPEGATVEPVPGALAVYGGDGDGRFAVVDEIEDAGSCGGVYDASEGAYAFETCDFTVQTFSPEGSLVTGAPAYLDGFGDSFVALLDSATGEEVARLDPPDSIVSSTVWLDEDTIASLVHNYTEQTWSIVTLTVGDDAPVTVVGPAPGNDADSPIHLVR